MLTFWTSNSFKDFQLELLIPGSLPCGTPLGRVPVEVGRGGPPPEPNYRLALCVHSTQWRIQKL